MNKMTIGDLMQRQALPLPAKVTMTMNRIRSWYEYWGGSVYVSFSGGKDSTVLLHLVRRMYPDVPAVFTDTGLEYPEIKEFVKTIPNTIILRPEISFKQVIEQYGYPVVSKEVAHVVQYARKGSNWAVTKLAGYELDGVTYSKWKDTHYHQWEFLKEAPFPISAYCCDVMKKRPMKKYEKESGNKPFIGTMTCESALRQTAWLRTGCNAYEGCHIASSPLSFWKENDVLQYIHENNIPICSVYGDVVQDEKGNWKTTGLHRTGCMFCMFGAQREKSPNRFERMKETHPQLYEYCMKPKEENGLGLDEVLTYLKIKH